MRPRIVFAVSYAFAAALLPAAPAFAGDDQEGYTCKELWEMRNGLFKNGGYCFKSPDAIKEFGNDGCRHHDEADVPFSDNERSMMRDIRNSEKQQGC